MKTKAIIYGLCAAAALTGAPAGAQQETVLPAVAKDGAMTVTLLGTGTPEPSVDRYGPSSLVTVAGKTLLIDAGRGVITRMMQIGVDPGSVDQVFITHYHHDHMNGLADLWLTARLPPFGDRQVPFRVTGPTGLKKITDGLYEAFTTDIEIREEDEKFSHESTLFDVTEFDGEGVVYEQDGVTVTAFDVNHGEHIKPSVGYRVSYQGNDVIFSGDTKYDENIVKYGEGSDLVVHEVAIAEPALAELPKIQRIMDHHTVPADAGRIFSQIDPQMAVYSHILSLHRPTSPKATDQDYIDQTRETYDGPLLVGSDLMAFRIDGDLVAGQADLDPIVTTSN